MDTFYITRVTPNEGAPRFERHHDQAMIEVWAKVLRSVTDSEKPATVELWEIGPESRAPWDHDPDLMVQVDAQNT